MEIRDFVKATIEAGEKQVAMSRKTGVSQGTIYKLLYTDTKPTIDTIIKICKGYDLPLKDYIEEAREWPQASIAPLAIPYENLPAENQRVLQIMTMFDLDDESFCRRVELEPAELTSIKAGLPVTGVLLRALAYEFELRLRWLRLGELPPKAQGQAGITVQR